MRISGALLIVLLTLSVGIASATAPVSPTSVAPSRDGRDDFNFLFGRWHTHYRILRNRLVHDTVWYTCDGDSLVTHFWNNAGNLEVGTLRCPPPRGYVDSLTLRTYSQATHQWSLWWGTKKLGVSPPPQVGHFDANGIGEFFANDAWKGRPVIVRYQWKMLNGLPHFEQAYSTDGRATWETNWICDYTHA
jgi:hypothetical protein